MTPVAIPLVVSWSVVATRRKCIILKCFVMCCTSLELLFACTGELCGMFEDCVSPGTPGG